jgi:peptide/nickel transport system permease protein
VLVLWAALSAGLFALVHVLPGSPEAELLAGHPELSADDAARRAALAGLDLPLATRYRCWLLGRNPACPRWPNADGLLQGELGWSTRHQRPVRALLQERLPNTLSLMLPALGLSVLLAVGLGVLAATRGRWDRAVAGVAAVGLALPAHWLGLVAILVFAVGLGWLPSGGVQGFEGGGRGPYLILPVGVLSVYYVGRFTRYVRAALREELGKPYLDTARAKGLTEAQVILRHALPNALIPLVTVVAQSLPVLFSGALVVERVFAYPGMGLLIFESVEERDHLAAVTVFLIYAGLTFLAAGLADVIYQALDPRTRSR